MHCARARALQVLHFIDCCFVFANAPLSAIFQLLHFSAHDPPAVLVLPALFSVANSGLRSLCDTGMVVFGRSGKGSAGPGPVTDGGFFPSRPEVPWVTAGKFWGPDPGTASSDVSLSARRK